MLQLRLHYRFLSLSMPPIHQLKNPDQTDSGTTAGYLQER